MKELEEKDTTNKKFAGKDSYTEADERKDYQNDYSVSSKPAQLFYFDPNTISEDGWKRLGLRDKTIATIQNYRNKGGKFRKPGDLQKVYGLGKSEYERLAPYIKMETEKEEPQSEKLIPAKTDETKNYSTSSRYSIVDINTADTSALIALPGIGSKLALRIVTFRDKLGGFYAIEQVKEIYGLQDSVFQKLKHYLKLDNKSVKKINVNTATKDELKIHPYVKWNIANAIVEYRNQHGPFAKLEDLKKITVIDGDAYNKLAIYLTL